MPARHSSPADGTRLLRVAADDFGAAAVESGADGGCDAEGTAVPDGVRASAGSGADRGDSTAAVWPGCGARGQSCTVAGACSTRGAAGVGSADPGLAFNPIIVGEVRGVSFAKRLAGGLAVARGVDGRAAANGGDFVGARLLAAARGVSLEGGAAFELIL